MPTYRKLHTKIIDSFDFAEMPDDFCRVFWMLLIVTVDSEGRAIDNPAWLRSRMFPLRSDVADAQIENTMAWLADRTMVIRYEVDGRRYFYIPKFKTYQSGTEREAKSILPAPPDLLMSNSRVDHEQEPSSSTASASASVNESESASVVASESDPEFPAKPEIEIVHEITGLYPDITSEPKVVNNIRACHKRLGAPPRATLLEELTKAWENWCSSKTKDGRPYNPANWDWTERAALGFYPKPSNGKSKRILTGAGGEQIEVDE